MLVLLGWVVMRRTLLLVALGGCAGACPADDAPARDDEASTSTAATTHADASTTDDPTEPSPTTAATAESGEPEPWLEVGWGLSEFNAFDGVLPVIVGPQGLSMFSLPLRGQGFHNPASPAFDDPDVPVLQAWVDVDGHMESPGGHLSEVVDYPALFYPTFDDPEVLEGVAVWLVIPDGVDPMTLVGLPAHVHAEMIDKDGLLLSDDHDLVIGEVPPPPDGP